MGPFYWGGGGAYNGGGGHFFRGFWGFFILMWIGRALGGERGYISVVAVHLKAGLRNPRGALVENGSVRNM